MTDAATRFGLLVDAGKPAFDELHAALDAGDIEAAKLAAAKAHVVANRAVKLGDEVFPGNDFAARSGGHDGKDDPEAPGDEEGAGG